MRSKAVLLPDESLTANSLALSRRFQLSFLSISGLNGTRTQARNVDGIGMVARLLGTLGPLSVVYTEDS